MSLRIKFDYGTLTGQDEKVLKVQMWVTEKSKDGYHIAKSCFFDAGMLGKLSKKEKMALFDGLHNAIETCIVDITQRQELENMDSETKRKRITQLMEERDLLIYDFDKVRVEERGLYEAIQRELMELESK